MLFSQSKQYFNNYQTYNGKRQRGDVSVGKCTEIGVGAKIIMTGNSGMRFLNIQTITAYRPARRGHCCIPCRRTAIASIRIRRMRSI